MGKRTLSVLFIYMAILGVLPSTYGYNPTSFKKVVFAPGNFEFFPLFVLKTVEAVTLNTTFPNSVQNWRKGI